MITFNELTFRNFLSVGNNDVTIDLNDNKTTLIHGSNGSGKSTILDALCYCLFNKPFRKVNLPQLVNSQNKKGMLTEVKFSIGKNVFIVRRGSKPKVFEVWKNGELLMAKAADKDNQAHLEQNILKLTYKSFTQIVILGSSNFVPFMQLPTVGRRECVEDFLDIKVFSTMSIIAKERLRGLKDRVVSLEGDISNLGYKMDLQRERIAEVEEKSKADAQEIRDDIDILATQSDDRKSLVKRLASHAGVVMEFIQGMGEPSKKRSEWNRMKAQLDSKLAHLHKEIEFYKTNDTCPTCSQSITNETKDKRIKETTTESQKLIAALITSEENLTEFDRLLRIRARRQEYVNQLKIKLAEHSATLANLKSQSDKLKVKLKDSESDTGSLDKELVRLSVQEEVLKELQESVFKAQQDVVEHDIVASMLKDGGIKAQIVKKYLPVMNKFIRQYLTDLDFPIHFTLDEEFTETIASPLHQDFSYASFSEGQKARIDLALMLTWREIGKIKNSVTTNLLVLDEVFSSSLDEVGKEALLAILRYKLDDNQRVVVIDHTLSGEFKSKFHHSIEVSKVKGFSRYD
jgi:DNA repair exonuclease SbcCD ATPase subunit